MRLPVVLASIVALSLSVSLSACTKRSTSRAGASGPYGANPAYPNQPYPNQGNPGYPNQPYPNQGNPGYPNQPYPQNPTYPQNPGYPQQPAPTATTAPTGPVSNDPINAVNIGFMRQRAGNVLAELVAALPEDKRAKVQNVPLFADPTVGEVNAFAACDDQHQPLMAVSDGLLEIMGQSARFKAADEIFGTRKLDEYTTFIVNNVRQGQPIPRPPQGFLDAGRDMDGRKVARQAVLFDEQLAFVMGHELSHHYLGHTGCANGGGSRGVGVGDFGRLLSNALPAFNQTAEIAADVSGTNNVLAAGARRTGAKWTEEGGIISLGFFSALDRLTPQSILFAFESDHPPPALRIPIIQNAANAWRLTGGNPLPVLGF